MKKLMGVCAILLGLVVSPLASAHVVVKPAEVKTGSFESFSVGVPNEKDIPTTSLRLVMPEGLQFVSVKLAPGWNVDIKKSGAGEDAIVKEVTWSGNEIAAGFRDDFVFSAKTPDTETSLTWKAYQTYSDGSVVAWDMAESSDSHSDDTSTPASITKVVNSDSSTTSEDSKDQTSNVAGLALILSLIGVGLGGVALFKRR